MASEVMQDYPQSQYESQTGERWQVRWNGAGCSGPNGGRGSQFRRARFRRPCGDKLSWRADTRFYPIRPARHRVAEPFCYTENAVNDSALYWMPAILALFGSLIVVVITAWLNTRALSAQIEALRAEVRGEMGTVRAEMGTLRAEMSTLRAEVRGEIGTVRAEMAALRIEMDTLRAGVKQYIAEAELRIMKEILELKSRLERLGEQRSLVRQS